MLRLKELRTIVTRCNFVLVAQHFNVDLQRKFQLLLIAYGLKLHTVPNSHIHLASLVNLLGFKSLKNDLFSLTSLLEGRERHSSIL